MKFETVTLENLFAYEGSVEFDFSDTTPERNVALVWGRNGMGKTSFLRSLKLLFLGIEPKRMRSVGEPARVLPQRQYVVGDGAGWSGMVNRRAVQRAEREGREPTASVSAVWQLDDGSRMSAERRWTTSQFGYHQSLSVYDATGKITDDAAQDRLAELMPADFVDFFFFDGDDIKGLAESDERKAINFDRLLRLTFLGDLVDELQVLIRDRSHGSEGGYIADRLGEAEAALARSDRASRAAQEELGHLDDQLTGDTARMRRLLARRETLGTVASDAQREEMETALADLRRELAEQQEAIAKSLPVAAPLVVNLATVRAALAEVDARLAGVSPAERGFVSRITPRLAGWIADGPVDLERSEVDALAEHVGALIVAELPSDEPAGMFAGMDELRADRLRNVLSRWSVAGLDVARAHVVALGHARRLSRELREAEEALMRLEVGSQVNLEEYRRVTAEIAQLDEAIADANQRKGQLRGRIEDGATEVDRLRKEIARLQSDQERVSRDRAEARSISRLGTALNELRDEMRERTRVIVQERINARFRELVRTHPVIERIEIDENYTMNFISVDGGFIGRSSLSSGIKQLAATALLWAMKDIAALDMPVVVDTPLARIDRENQDNMLSSYYPHLAAQVIVLPTNAEIDARKFELIRNHVEVQLRIRNDEGDQATVSKGSLLES